MRRHSSHQTEEPGWRHRPRLLFCLFVLTALVFSLFVTRPARAQFHALADEIVVAAVGSPASPINPAGPDVIAGVKHGIEQINANGGLLGKSVRLVVYTDDCTATSGAAVATRIVTDGAALVVGHVCSSSAIAAAAVYAKHQIVMITPGARAPKLTSPRAGPFIYRLAPRDDRFGHDTAEWIASAFRGKRIALVHDKSVDARTLTDSLASELGIRYIKPVSREAFVAGEREYNVIANRLAAAVADVVFIPALPIEARIIFDRWRRTNPDAVLVGGPSLAVPDLQAQTAGPDSLIVMLPTDTSTDAPVERHKSRVGARAQASVEAWASAARLAATVLPGPVSARLNAHGLTTNIGDVSFTPSGDALLPAYKPYRWRDGRWQPMEFHP